MVQQGFIENVDVKTGSKNGLKWVLKKLTIDGKKYSYFGGGNFNVGDYVEFEAVPDGQFEKIKNINKIEKPVTNSQQASVSQQVVANKLDIIRQSSLKVAVDILAHNLDVNAVKAIAEVLTRYVIDGISDEELEAQMESYLKASENTEEIPF